MAFDLDNEELKATRILHGVDKEEIEVGDYIRTIDGRIGTIKHKITVLENDKFARNEYRTSFNVFYYTDKQMQECGWKIKNNIVDLIEVGDYVNGYKVIDKDLKNEMICLLMPFNEENQSKYNIVWNTKYFIKSIVTKEQFANIEYKVKE